MFVEMKTFEDVMQNNASAYKIMNHARYNLIDEQEAMKLCIIYLANLEHKLMNRIIELESIAPRKYLMPDGSYRIWRCPVDMIPEFTMTQCASNPLHAPAKPDPAS